MNDRFTDEMHESAVADAPPASRSRRRAAAREALTRRALAGVAGIGVVATVLALVALAGSPKPTAQLRLPSAQAANAAFVSGLTASTAAPATAATSSSKAVAVTIANYAFAPATLAVGVGTTVTWTNTDTAPHTVTISSGPVKFSSPALQKGDTYSFTFTTPGTYSYYCAVHPNMMATVVVTGSPTSTPTSTPTMTPTSTPTITPTMTSSSVPPSMSMSMPGAPAAGGSCAVSYGLQTLLTHINTAHLDESPGQQVNDILNVDQYIGNHLALVQNILSPLTGGGLTTAVSDLLQTFLTHVNTAHLDESPGQQVNDILNVNTYIGNHLALVQRMLSSSEALTC